MKNRYSFILAMLVVYFAGPALAGRPVEVSEPGTLTLLGLAGVVVAAATIRRWRK
jgi:hypothetical protein